jgi:hypothetical protein
MRIKPGSFKHFINLKAGEHKLRSGKWVKKGAKGHVVGDTRKAVRESYKVL